MLKVGFIGAGSYGINHIKNVSESKIAGVSAIATRHIETAEKARKIYGGNAYGSAEEMLEKESLDACYISIPPFAHGDIEIMAIEKGIPICVDKPLSNRMDVALKIESLLKNKNVISSVGYQWRYFDIVKKAKELIKKSNVIFVLGRWLSRLPEGIMPWLGIKRYSGGQLIEQATHLFDLIRYFFGEPSSMQSCGNPNFPGKNKNDIDCASSVNMVFDNGIIANISCACALPLRYSCGLTIMTDNEILEFLSAKSGMKNVTLNIINKEGKKTLYPRVEPMVELDRTFLEAVNNNDQSIILSPYSDAVKTLKLTVDATENKLLTGRLN